jgi:4a-hydroxytetrahydrobiopterin dehydratase
LAKKTIIYDEHGIAEQIAALPRWRYADGVIQRTYKTANWKATMMVVSTIGHLCEAAWHHPDLAVSYDSVTVKLSTHSPKGISDKDFAMAAKIEAVIGWQPAPEDGPFDGTPGDPKFAYIKYD